MILLQAHEELNSFSTVIQALTGISALVLSFVIYIQSSRIKSLTDVVDALSSQTVELQIQSKSAVESIKNQQTTLLLMEKALYHQNIPHFNVVEVRANTNFDIPEGSSPDFRQAHYHIILKNEGATLFLKFDWLKWNLKGDFDYGIHSPSQIFFDKLEFKHLGIINHNILNILPGERVCIGVNHPTGQGGNVTEGVDFEIEYSDINGVNFRQRFGGAFFWTPIIGHPPVKISVGANQPQKEHLFNSK